MEKISLVYEGSPQRIDHYLTEHYEFSRNFFHHIIERGGILVNGRTVKKSYKLQAGDSIDIDDLQRYLEPSLLADCPAIELPIVYEQEDYLVINKPKGVLAHPNSIRDLHTPSVVGFLFHRYKNLPSIGSFIRAGLIHRLDKETDGLMIIAKTELGLKHFKELFNQKSEATSIEEKEAVPLRKFYKAVCEITSEGFSFLQKISSEGFPFYIVENVIPQVPRPVVKLGITKILSVDVDADHAVLDLEILTGRTHQIRYHLSKHGLPIVGDYLYGKDGGKELGLQASRLEFQDPHGEYRVFELS